MMKNEKREHGDVLYEAILTLKDLEECKKFFPTCAPWRS